MIYEFGKTLHTKKKGYGDKGSLDSTPFLSNKTNIHANKTDLTRYRSYTRNQTNLFIAKTHINYSLSYKTTINSVIYFTNIPFQGKFILMNFYSYYSDYELFRMQQVRCP